MPLSTNALKTLGIMPRLPLALVLLTALVASYLPASDPGSISAAVGTLTWGQIDSPGVDPFTVVSPSEANHVAIGPDPNGNNALYLVDIPNSRVLKSTNGGASWMLLSGYLAAAGALLPAFQIAVAPDNKDFIAVVTNSRKSIFLSNDGGTNWSNSGLTGLALTEQISDIDVSRSYPVAGGNARDIAICTRDGTPAAGKVFAMQLTPIGLGVWANQAAPAQSFSRLKLSPNYVSDQSMVVIGSNATNTFLNIGFRDFTLRSTSWNLPTNWPVYITPTSAGPTWNQLITSDIVLAIDFSGQTDYYRRIYTCFDDNSATGRAGVYYVDNHTVYNLYYPDPRPYSLVGYGSLWNIKLTASSVTGASATGSVPIYYCYSPTPSGNTWTIPERNPSGAFTSAQARAQLIWNPDGIRCYAATFSTAAINNAAAWYNTLYWTTGLDNDESAFSVTVDDGFTWNQSSYIDTTISGINDLAVSPDGATAYLTTWNTGPNLESIWRTRSTPLGDIWERVRCVQSALNQPIVRLAPEYHDGSIVFWADIGGRRVQKSINSGQSWQDSLARLDIQDMAVTGANRAYTIQADGLFCRGGIGAYGGTWVWENPFRTGITSGHTIAIQGDTVVIGGTASSRIAYSLNGGATFSITPDLPTPGNQHVAIDPRFSENRCIYIADDSISGQIYRWFIGRSTDFDSEVISVWASPRYGVVVTTETTEFGPALYSLVSLVGGWGVERTLYPRSPLTKDVRQGWDNLNNGLPFGSAFASEPSALKIFGVSPNVTLWIVDTSGANRILAFKDTMTIDSPGIIAPRTDEKTGSAVIPIGPDGTNAAFGLRWDTVSTSSEYEAQISLTTDFSDVVTAAPFALPGPPYYLPNNPGQPAWLVNSGSLMSGQTYYARVRVRRAVSGQSIRTLWSPAHKLTLRLGLPLMANFAGPSAVIPPNGAGSQRIFDTAFSWSPVQGATEYRFRFSRDAQFASVLVDSLVPSAVYIYTGQLDYDTTYFWRVEATRPFASEGSPVFTFMTMSHPDRVEPAAPPKLNLPPVVVVTMPIDEMETPVWAWVVIGAGIGLVLEVSVVLALMWQRNS